MSSTNNVLYSLQVFAMEGGNGCLYELTHVEL